MLIYICSTPLIPRRSFFHKMASNDLILILESRIRNGGILQYILVVALNVHWALARNAHHSNIVPQSAKILTTLLHSNEFRTKATTFDAGLFLREPTNKCAVKIY